MVLATFDDAIERSAAPTAVRLALDRLLAAHPGLADRLAADDELLAAVVAVVAASRSLTRLLETDPAAVDVLADVDGRRPLDADGDAAALVRGKRLEFLRIAARDLLGRDSLETTSATLARLAADVFDTACRLAGLGDELAVIGMGKFGGLELNYASDVDVLFVGRADDRRVRALVDLARPCFRIDLNLRPEGRDGALIRSLASYQAYWARWAQPWEFQALLKARAVAGDRQLGEVFARSAAEHLWTRRFSADDLRSIRAMKSRAEDEIARRGLTDREIKRGRGGIRDVEFAVQLLQMVHGPLDPGLRSPTTLTALAELADAGYVAADDADQLAAAYRTLRTIEHRLQLVDEQQVHAVPSDPAALDHLARVLGFRSRPSATATEQFETELHRHQATVRAIHQRIWFRPLLEAFSSTGGPLSPEAAAARLAAFGFTDLDRTRQAVAELTRGLTRSSRLMQQLLPLLLDWLSQSPDPDVGLLGLRHLASGAQRSTALATAFRESPEVARRLCVLLGTSRHLGTLIRRNPDLIPRLAEPAPLPLRTRDELLAVMQSAAGWRAEVAERHAALKRITDRELVPVAAHDVFDLADVPTVGAALTALAEAALEAALESLGPPLPFAIVAMGRFGGAELSYASDLDVLFAYEGSTPSDFEAAEKVATAFMKFVGQGVPRLYAIDADLRPEGRQGPLARSVEAYRMYFERWAEPWERLAMVRARPVAGNLELGRTLLEALDPLVWRDGLPDDDRREIRRIKARIERERMTPNEDPQFHLKLGRGSLSDVEFTAQLLQLQHRVRSPGTMAALNRLAAGGYLDEPDREVLAAAYRFCERTRNRLFLITNSFSDSLPQQAERLSRLSRSLGTTPGELRDEYRRLTRRARRVVERLFYGRS